MAVASRSVRVSSFSFRGIFFTGLALLLVIGLFFIPEIIQFQKKVSGSPSTGNPMKTLQTATVAKPQDEKESQLSRIASLLDSGYLDRLSNNNSKEQPTAAEKKNVKPDSATATKKSAITTESGITWNSLKGKASRQALKKAQEEALVVLKTIPSDRSRSRFALMSLANGIGQIVDGKAEKTLSATEAFRYLEGLQANAANQLVREGIDQAAYKRFMTIDFGPVARAWSARLSGQLIPFNPELTITKITMTRRESGRQTVSSHIPLMVSFEGYVVGNDVEGIELISGGNKLNQVKPKKVDSSGFRGFKVKRFELRGGVLLRVTDNKGRVYQKLYSLYPRARIFQNRKGRFIIPKAVSDFDKRLDRFFTVRVSVPAASASDAFLQSQGFEKF